MTDPNFHIRTKRLYLSYLQPFNPDHCKFLVELYNSPEFIAAEGETSIRTDEDAKQVISNRFRIDHARNGYGQYLISMEPNDTGSDEASKPFSKRIQNHQLIGTVSLMKGELPNAFTAPDLGFAILPEHMRKGYAKESSQGLMDYVERELRVRDILGLHDPKNEGSAGVFRSLGFLDQGVHYLKLFGGVNGRVWIRPGMSEDLTVYGIEERPNVNWTSQNRRLNAESFLR